MFVLSNEKDYFKFPELEDLGVKNFCTTSRLGNLSFSSNLEAPLVVEDLFRKIGVPSEHYFQIGADSVDQINIIDEKNIEIYSLFKSKKYTKINCDSVITNQSIPIVISPADCMVLVLVGENDSGILVGFVHLGFTGAILDLHLKTIRHMENDFNSKIKKAFVFPFISGEDYIKNKNDIRVEIAKSHDKKWDKFLVESGDFVNIFFGDKVLDDLAELNISYSDSNLNTFDQHSNGILFSNTYSKRNDLDPTLRFCVGFYINKPNLL